MTKAQIIKEAKKRGFSAKYSGKLKRFFFTKARKMDIHAIINSK